MSTNRSDRTQLVADTLTVIGIVLATSAVVGILFAARHVLMLIFGAILIGVVVNRLGLTISDRLPWDMKRGHRVGLVLGIGIVLIIGGGFGFAHSINDQIIRLTDRVDDSATRVIEAAKAQPVIKRLREEVSLVSVLPSSEKSLGLAQTFFSSTFGALTDVLILVILAAYLSVSPSVYRTGLLRILPVGWRSKTSELLSESADTLWHWMLGRMLAMAIVGFCFAVGLAILGVPMPIELGIFAGLVTFVPNLGGIAAVIPALLLASNESSSTVVGVLVLYLLIQFAESYFITPLVQQKQLQLPPAIVILAQVVSGLLFGLWGIMFATPLVAVVILLLRRLYVEDYLEAAAA